LGNWGTTIGGVDELGEGSHFTVKIGRKGGTAGPEQSVDPVWKREPHPVAYKHAGNQHLNYGEKEIQSRMG